jgi:Flp pilus assembly pilin Flp
MTFLLDERGQGTLEYGLILGLIAMIAVGALLLVGNDTNGSLQHSASSFNNSTLRPYSSGP